MGILIRTNDEKNSLIINTKINFMNNSFYESIKELNLLITSYHRTEELLNEKIKGRKKESLELERIITEQKYVTEQIDKILSEKKNSYNNFFSRTNNAAFSKINKELNVLIKKQESNDSKISQITSYLKRNEVTSISTHQELQTLDNEIKKMRNQINIEYQKINWGTIEHSRIILSLMFENVKDESTKSLLKQITKKNFELEKIIIHSIHKVYDKTVKNNKYQKQHDILNQIDALININNKIYSFIYELISTNDLMPEMFQLIQVLDYVLNYVSDYAIENLIKEKTLDISHLVKKIKSVSELNTQTIVKSYRPAIFYKRKIDNYNSKYMIVNSIITDVELYLKNINKKEEVQKRYFIY